MRYLQHPQLLGSSRRERLVAALESEGPLRASSASLGHTGNGNVEQLAPGPGYVSAELSMIRELVASMSYQATATAFALPDPSRLAPQVFPVWMRGSIDEPASQRPHVDNLNGKRPLLTSVYYARIRNADGGQIVLGAEPDRLVLQPDEDDLVAFPGDTVHAVSDLRGGDRLSIVCNFYLAGDKRG